MVCCTRPLNNPCKECQKSSKKGYLILGESNLSEQAAGTSPLREDVTWLVPLSRVSDFVREQ